MNMKLATAIWYEALLYLLSLHTEAIYAAICLLTVVKITMSYYFSQKVINAIYVLNNKNCAVITTSVKQL